jgi:hypothetical protein
MKIVKIHYEHNGEILCGRTQPPIKTRKELNFITCEICVKRARNLGLITKNRERKFDLSYLKNPLTRVIK